MNKKGQLKIKDIIIYSIIVLLLGFIAFLFFKDAKQDDILDSITQYIGTLVTILLGVIGIFEFAYDNGLTLLVPNSFENYKEKKLNEQTKHYLKEFFNHEAEYFSQHSNSRITFFLNQLGLSKNQFEQLKLNVFEIKLLPLRNLSDAENKIRKIIQKGNIVLSQDGKDSNDLVYKEVKYFLNFTDIMFIDDYYTQIIDCLSYLIMQKTKEEKFNYNRILVSNRGNFLLGMGISQKLNTALIKITESPLIFSSKSWIGNFSENNQDCAIIVHDVLVSSKQIKESIKIVEQKTKICAIFCIVNRLDCTGEKQFAEEYDNIPIYSLLKLDDNAIEELIDEAL